MIMTSTNLPKALRALGFGLALAALAACTPITRFHGFTPQPADLAQVQVGQTSRADVVSLFGPPVSEGAAQFATIYYVSSRFEHFGPFAPQEVDRSVLAISFDSGDRVRNITRYGLDDGRVVALDRRVTDDGIADVSVLEQLLGSFGRFDAGALLGDDAGGL